MRTPRRAQLSKMADGDQELVRWMEELVPVPNGGASGYVLTKASGTDFDLIWAPAGGGGVPDGDKGDIVVTLAGTTWTIDANAVSNTKLADMATQTIKGRLTAGVGDPQDLTAAQAKSVLAITAGDVSGLGTLATQNGTFSGTSSGTNTGDQTITLTGDVTGSGTGSFAATIGNNIVTYAKMQDVSAASRLLGRGSAAGAGDPEEITLGPGLSMAGTVLSSSGVSVITAAPTGDQADWNPAGFGSGNAIIVAQPGGNTFIGGIVGGTANQTVQLINDSAFVIMLIDEDSASTAANRFLGDAGSTIILPQENVSLRYSATRSRWVLAGQSRDLFDVRNRSQMVLPSTGAAVVSMGLHGHSITATISTTAPTATPTDDFLENAYFQGTNSGAAGSSDVRSNVVWAMRGGTAGRQGFIHTGRVRFPALGAATGAVYAGLTNSAAASTTLPGSATNIIAIGAQQGHTNLRLFHNDGAGAATQVDLGANFPAPSATAAYEYLFYSAPGGTTIEAMLRRLDSRQLLVGTLTTDLPSTTTPLGHRVQAIVGATAAANTVQANYLLTLGL